LAKFFVYKDNASEYRWRFRADNGKIVADSAEGYTNKSDCMNGIRIVQTESPRATVEDQTLATTYR
jgi:uncharacterized protein